MSHLYFNNAFSKKPRAEVTEAMFPFLNDHFENPLTESAGAEIVRAEIDRARDCVARLLFASPEEIVFVSSGTEANNWALKGTAYAQKRKRHMVISAIEHFSVYQTAQHLERNGYELTIVPVDSKGRVDVSDIEQSMTASTFLVSVLSGSDEIGVIQDVEAISGLKKRFPDVLFHTDAVQFLAYETLDLRSHPFDLVTLNSNALYGPPGIGALYMRSGTRLAPLLHGGMQEGGRRPGLQSAAMIAGFGKAARLNQEYKAQWKLQLQSLQQQFFTGLEALELPVTGDRTKRLVDNIHVIGDVDGEAVLTLLQEFGAAATSGSTCYQYAQKESHVLKALGIAESDARGALLFTLDVDHTSSDVQELLEHAAKALRHLRSLKPDSA